MPAKDMGTKHTCFKCGTRFYDLRKPEPICPKCGADQRQSPASKPSASEKRRTPARPIPPKPEVEEIEAEAELEEELEAEEEVEEPEETDEP
jgi:uncharacterized protein (TIGR02300 family)